MMSTSFQLDEFYLDLQEDGSRISLLSREAIEYCPYPGLRPFRTSEFQLFRGREGQAEELLTRLRKKHFLAVIGSSGTGKSSLIRAGLIPQLYGGYLHEAGSRWNIAICRPGRDPLENLSIALSSNKCQSRDKERILAEHALIEPVLRRSVYGILEVNELLQAKEGGIKSNLLIIIDQFEELFRFEQKVSKDSHVKNHFVNLLLKASVQLDSSVYVIITMRSEFLGECVKYRGLPEVINEGQYLVPQLSRSQVKDVIEGPLNLAGRQMEAGLSSMLLNEIEETRLKDSLDQLPILQHALMRTYKQAATTSGQKLIAHQDYITIGGMDRALALHAETKYNSFAEPEQAADGISRKQRIVQIVFQALTDLSSDQKGGRRPVALATIHAITQAIGAGSEETNDVIDSFRDIDTSFIMPPANTPLVPSLIIDISHESLMRNWERLNGWMLEEVKYGELYDTLNDRRILYEREEDRHNRLRGILLKELIKWRAIPYHNSAWAARYHKKEDLDKAADLFEKNMAFLQYSETQYEIAEQQEKAELEQKIEAEQQNKNNRRITRITSIAAVLSVILLALAVIGMRNAIKSQNTAEEQALQTRKKIFEIYLRDSTDWWVNPLLTNERRQRILDTLFYLYTSAPTHKPSKQDSITGKRLETSLLMLKKAYNITRLSSWGNYLHLLKEARDYDTNFVTSLVLDSMLSITIPINGYCTLDSADQPSYRDQYRRLLMPIPGKDSAAFILVNRHGISQYHFDGRPKTTWIKFTSPYNPLAIDKGATRILLASGRRLMLYDRDRTSGRWQLNSSLSKAVELLAPAPKPNGKPFAGKPVQQSQNFLPGNNSNNAAETIFNMVAAFSDDGNYLAVHDGDSACRLLQLSTGKLLQQFKTGGGTVHKLVFNHSNRQLLLWVDNSAILLNAGLAAIPNLPLTINSLSGQVKSLFYLSGWAFSPDDRLVYAWSDSIRHTWGAAKGDYKGIAKMNIGNAGQYIPVAGGQLLYIKHKDEYSEMAESPMFIYLYDSVNASKCFPWHNSAVKYVCPGSSGRVISEDITSVYRWHLQSRPLKETDIDQYIDKQLLANYYYDMGDERSLTLNNDEKITYYKKSVHYGNTNASIWFKIASYYLDYPTPDSAIFYFRKSIEVATNPFSKLMCISSLENLFFRLNLFDSALVYASQALKLDTTNVSRWNEIGRIYYGTNRFTMAMPYYYKALTLNPNSIDVLTNLGDIFIEIKQYDSALVYINKASLISNYNVTVWEIRARYFNRIKNYSASMRNADSAIQFSPLYSGGYAELGYAYLKTGKDDLATETLTKAIQLDTADYVPYTYQACLYALHSDKQKAIDYLKKAINKGFRMWDWLDNEQSFDGLRNDKAFKELRK